MSSQSIVQAAEVNKNEVVGIKCRPSRESTGSTRDFLLAVDRDVGKGTRGLNYSEETSFSWQELNYSRILEL